MAARVLIGVGEEELTAPRLDMAGVEVNSAGFGVHVGGS